MSSIVKVLAVQKGKVLFSELERTHLIALDAEGDMKDEEGSVQKALAEKLHLHGDIIIKLRSAAFGDGNIYFADIADSEKLPQDEGWVWHSLKEYDSFGQEEIKYFEILYREINQRSLRLDYTYRISNLISEFRSGAHRPEIRERLRIDQGISKGCKAAAIGFALVLGLIFDLFFYEHELALSYPIFMTVLLSFFFFVDKDKVGRIRLIDIGLLAAILMLSLPYAIYNNQFFRALNFLAVPLLVCTYTVIATNRGKNLLGLLGEVMSRIFCQSFRCFLKPVFFLKELLPQGGHKKNSGLRKNLLIGLGISALLLLILIPMLMKADMAFNYYLGNIDRLFGSIDFGDAVPHLIIIVFIALYVFGYAWSFKYPMAEAKQGIGILKGKKLEPVIVMTVLTVVNLLYLLFTLVQFSYLYAGGGSNLPQGLTYAEYARSGFFELVKVTVLNLIILLCAMNFAGIASKSVSKALRVLFSLLVLFTVNMLVSAFYRMHLYEQTYGYTELRIYVYIFMIFLSIVFMLAMVKIWYDRLPLLAVSAALALAFCIAVNYMNIESIIAGNNIARYYATGKIDMNYITTLSVDADPQIAVLLNDSQSVVRISAQSKLRGDLKMLQGKNSSWFEYNYNQARVKKLLEKEAAKLGND